MRKEEKIDLTKSYIYNLRYLTLSVIHFHVFEVEIKLAEEISEMKRLMAEEEEEEKDQNNRKNQGEDEVVVMDENEDSKGEGLRKRKKSKSSSKKKKKASKTPQKGSKDD